MHTDKAKKYMELARTTAQLFSKDQSTKVGCIILAPDSLQQLSQGYNGMPRGIDEKNDMWKWERPIKYKYVEHAERNAIYNAARRGTPLEKSIAVVTHFPCTDCARALIQSGINAVVTVQPDFSNERWGEDWQVSINMFEEASVDLHYSS